MTSIKRCMLIALAVLLSLSSVIVVFSEESFAASKYDEVYRKAENLEVHYPTGDSRFPKVDVTDSWGPMIFSTESKIVNRDYGNFKLSDVYHKMYDSWNKALANGSYAVSLFESEPVGVFGRFTQVVIHWTEDKSLSLKWHENSISLFSKGNKKPVYQAHLAYLCKKVVCSEGDPPRDYVVGVVPEFDTNTGELDTSSAGRFFSSRRGYHFLGFLANVTDENMNYPDGYEGQEINKTYNKKSVLRPDFKYDLNGMTLVATDHKEDLPKVAKDSDIGYYKWTILWSVFICPDGWDDHKSRCDTHGDAYDTQRTNKDDTFTYTFDKKMDYVISAEYVPVFCVREVLNGSPCRSVSLAEMAGKQYAEDYELGWTYVHLKVDGSIQSGDTRDAECNEIGYCKPKSQYEDCSKYGVDKLVDLVGCWVRNALIWFLSFIKWLIVPSTSDLQRSVDDLGKTLSGKLGFLWYPFEWIFKLFTQFTRSANTCSFGASGIPFADINGRFFNNRVHLSVCSAERDLPQVYNVSVFFIRIITVFGLLYALYRRIIAMLSVDRAISFARGDHK